MRGGRPPPVISDLRKCDKDSLVEVYWLVLACTGVHWLFTSSGVLAAKRQGYYFQWLTNRVVFSFLLSRLKIR